MTSVIRAVCWMCIGVLPTLSAASMQRANTAPAKAASPQMERDESAVAMGSRPRWLLADEHPDPIFEQRSAAPGANLFSLLMADAASDWLSRIRRMVHNPDMRRWAHP
jgi:hypothetical protein